MTDIRIYCDHADHAPRVCEIRTLRRVPGGWSDAPEKAYRLKMASGDSRERQVSETPFQIIAGPSGEKWARWDFRCNLERRRNGVVKGCYTVQLRQENLFLRLDRLADLGMFDLPLGLLAATL